MAKNLIIVESPAKAKTIEKYLGKDFKVTSSYGHVRDLPQKDLAIDLENSYEPNYEISDDKKKIVQELKKLAKAAETIYLATDEDREGEAISWHLCQILGLDPETALRITYTEITEKAIREALDNPRRLNLNLVNAQQARRILDRLVGYELSPVLWKKVKPSLSAGRVQSVAVRLIVDREREIQAFNPKPFFKVQADFLVTGKDGNRAVLKSELSERLDSDGTAMDFLQQCNGAKFSIASIEKKPSKRSPAAPFTTSTLQQEASRKLSFPVSLTMSVAQKLYEKGYITYMRTDSVNLSELALNQAAGTIQRMYGDNYHKKRQFKTKAGNAQEAHEAIRPSDLNLKEISESREEMRLYDLIWKRTVASQMSEAQIEKTIAKIDISSSDRQLTATGEVLVFDGFMKVYKESSDEDEEEMSGMLPPLSKGQDLPLIEMTATERFTRPPSRYTEASLVKKLEELSIGRPSTYAPTISTIQKRNYVKKGIREGVERNYQVLLLKDGNIAKNDATEMTGSEKGKLLPTDVGLIVNDFLVEHFQRIMDFSFTAEIEKQFDVIADGEMEWREMIDEFYQPFHDTVEDTTENAERAKGERLLGQHPENGEPVFAKLGRYGPMVQVGEVSDDKKPRFAKLREGQNLESISLEEALELFKLPRIVGTFEDKEVKASIGRFGPYVQHDGKFVSLPKDDDPYTVRIDRAVELILAKREADAKKTIKVFEEAGISILNGRWGPYIKKEKNNFRIPKDVVAEELTLEDCEKIIAEGGTKKKGRRAASKK